MGNRVKIFGLIFLATLCVTVAAAFPNPESRSGLQKLHPYQQQPPTPTPRLNCPVPPYPAAAYDRNPFPTEISLSFDQAGLNRLGDFGPPQPTLSPPQNRNEGQAPYAPCVLLKAIAYQESRWQHFAAGYDSYGYTKIGGTCDYGMMQIVSGMSGGGDFAPARANQEIPYNIGVGMQTLIKKWNALKLESGGFSGGAYLVGEGKPDVVEDWYYAVWAYNSFSWTNNPNNNCSVLPWQFETCRLDPEEGNWDPERTPFEGRQDQDPRSYPYQELIWGYAAHPPTYNEVSFWQGVDLTLPNRADVGGSASSQPNKNLPRPEPAHGSCSLTYLPLVRKDPTPAMTPTPTPTATPTATLTPTPPTCINGQNLIINGDLENTNLHGLWVQDDGDPLGNWPLIDTKRPWSGQYSIWMGGRDNANEEIYQVLTLPNNIDYAEVKFYFSVDTKETASYDFDKLYWDIKSDRTGNSLLTAPIMFSNQYPHANANYWVLQPLKFNSLHNLLNYNPPERYIRLSISDTTDSTNKTSFFIDDIEFKTYCQ